MIVGCKCEKCQVTKEWDNDLGAYYYYYECEACDYYWEGAIFNGLAPKGYYEDEA